MDLTDPIWPWLCRLNLNDFSWNVFFPQFESFSRKKVQSGCEVPRNLAKLSFQRFLILNLFFTVNSLLFTVNCFPRNFLFIFLWSFQALTVTLFCYLFFGWSCFKWSLYYNRGLWSCNYFSMSRYCIEQNESGRNSASAPWDCR